VQHDALFALRYIVFMLHNHIYVGFVMNFNCLDLINKLYVFP
jgi:hypothetical protein